MSQYNIFNMASGEELGRYFARTAEEAMNVMARVAGFADYSEACRSAPQMAEDLLVTEL